MCVFGQRPRVRLRCRRFLRIIKAQIPNPRPSSVSDSIDKPQRASLCVLFSFFSHANVRVRACIVRCQRAPRHIEKKNNPNPQKKTNAAIPFKAASGVTELDF